MRRATIRVADLPPGTVIRRTGGDVEMVQLHWGLQPLGPDRRSRTALRSEARRFVSHRCLIPASDFALGSGNDKVRFTLSSGDWFYFAGIWQPATPEWPESYAALTVDANPDVSPVHDRQMAVIFREDRRLWLDHAVPEEELLRSLEAGTFQAEAKPGQKIPTRRSAPFQPSLL